MVESLPPRRVTHPRAAKKGGSMSVYPSPISDLESAMERNTESLPSNIIGLSTVGPVDSKRKLEKTEDDEPLSRKRTAIKETSTAPKKAPTLAKKRATKTATTLLTTSTSAVISTPYHRNGQTNKPEPIGKPNIWANQRQALCEALPYYRAYQSGAYQNGGIIYGLMCDQETDPRDKLDDQILITRVGGGRVLDNSGNMVQTKDQKTSRIAKAYINNMKKNMPVAVIIGQGNSNCPSKLPHYYNVFDWFHVTDVWAETYTGLIRWMVRLEKIKLDEPSWWAPFTQIPAGFTSGFESAVTPVATKASCFKCKNPSKKIYNAGWVCLNNECEAFFRFPDGYLDIYLDYTREFLEERTKYVGKEPGPLAPPLLTPGDLKSMGGCGYDAACKRGIVCTKCGCCSRRLLWDCWECENPACDFVYSLPQSPVSIGDVMTKGTKPPKECNRNGVTKECSTVGLYQVYTYYFPGASGDNIGYVRHFKATAAINSEKDGPTDLFKELQRDGHNMKRGAVRQAGSTGEVRTAHWARNYGAPYKYGVKQESTPFYDAPAVILKTVKRLTWAGKVSVKGETFQDFNECLTIGYFQKSKIRYHDDGEKELGPTVVSISLGSSATMEWRPKSRSKIGPDDGKKSKQSSLKIHLEHGDIMVMHGTQIQKLYEHKVDPYGTLRYGVTCRYIRPETLPYDEDRRYSIAAGTIPADFKYDYDGEAELVLRTPDNDSIAASTTPADFKYDHDEGAGSVLRAPDDDESQAQ